MGLVHTHLRRGLTVAAAAAVLAFSIPAVASAASTTFLPTGAEQTFVVPAGVTSVHAVAIGGKGGEGTAGGPGGFGAVDIADLAVSPGEILYVEVGGNGASGPEGGAGGFNGGGDGGEGGYSYGGGGGGASDVRTGPRVAGVSLFQRLLVAAGGGGSGGDKCSLTLIGYGGTAGPTPTAGGASCGGGGQPGANEAGGDGATGCGEGIDTDGLIGAGGPGEWDHNGCFGPGGAGGGGGGGLYGGGGGGSSSAGGGGGAGSSGFGAGASKTVIATDTTGSPAVLLEYSASPANGGGQSAGNGGNSTPNPGPRAVTNPPKGCTVPKLTGKSFKAARKALANANCKAGTVKRRSPGAHTVVAQGQKSGKSLPAGTAVSVTLGGGGSHAHSHRHR